MASMTYVTPDAPQFPDMPESLAARHGDTRCWPRTPALPSALTRLGGPPSEGPPHSTQAVSSGDCDRTQSAATQPAEDFPSLNGTRTLLPVRRQPAAPARGCLRYVALSDDAFINFASASR